MSQKQMIPDDVMAERKEVTHARVQGWAEGFCRGQAQGQTEGIVATLLLVGVAAVFGYLVWWS